MGKSVEQIAWLLRQNGYEFNIRPSKHKDSTAQIIFVSAKGYWGEDDAYTKKYVG